MTSASAKAKGRKFQQRIRDWLLGLCEWGRFSSTSMGVNGSDIGDPLSLLPFSYCECRCRETWPSLEAIVKEMNGKAGESWAAIYGRNRTQPVVILSWYVFEQLMMRWFRGDE